MAEGDWFHTPALPAGANIRHGGQGDEGESSLTPGAKAADPQSGSALQGPRPWTLPARGLAVFHGTGDVARLSHYFLPRLILEGKRILFLDGANSADPRLLERLARERGVEFHEFSRRIQIARAFTCFQLTELIARLPRLLRDFPARVVIVTAFPDLYFDEDIRDGDARASFEQALRDLRRWAGSLPPNPSPRGRGEPEFISNSLPSPSGRGCPDLSGRVRGQDPPAGDGDIAATAPLAVAVFSAASTFAPSPTRRNFFRMACNAATEVWKFSTDEDRRLRLICEREISGGHRPPLQFVAVSSPPDGKCRP